MNQGFFVYVWGGEKSFPDFANYYERIIRKATWKTSVFSKKKLCVCVCVCEVFEKKRFLDFANYYERIIRKPTWKT